MQRFSLVGFACLLVLTASIATAQSQRPPFRFALTAVDSVTHQPRTTFALGESVSIRVSLTNQSRRARKVTVFPDSMLRLKLSSLNEYDERPRVEESYYGGTGGVISSGNVVYWTSREPRKMTLAPGETTSQIIADAGRHFFQYPAEAGSYTLTARHLSGLEASVSFRVVIDEAKSVPLLEQLAEAPVKEGRDSVQSWAVAKLKFLLSPWISGKVTDSEGRVIKEVRIVVTGTKETYTETVSDGRYLLSWLEKGGSYTLTPEFYDRGPGELRYTFEPASKNISNLTGKIPNVDFIATRVRVNTNVAYEDEGSKANASSTRDIHFEAENVIDGIPAVSGWGTGADGWNDGTPNKFPDWVEVEFGRTRTINSIHVYTVPDNYKDSPQPDRKQTFSKYGITDYDVQYWNGRTWRTVPGGAIRNNRNVWRVIDFPVVATHKIRVVVLNGLGGESRIAGIEAYQLNELPQAKIAAGHKGKAKRTVRATGYTNSPVYFDTDFSDRDGVIEDYELDFGDNTKDYEWSLNHEKAGDKPQLTHRYVYADPGTYTVRLRVVDNLDEVTDATIILTITNPPKKKPNLTSRNRSNLRSR